MDKNISDYKIVEKLGTGTNGSVYIVSDKHAQKFILKHYRIIKSKESFLNEIEVLRIINNYPNSVHYIKHKKYKDGYYILFKYKETKSLQYYRQQKYRFTITECLQMVHDISKELDFLYKNNILHTDLMASNVVYDGDKFSLIDFGNSQFKTDIKNLDVQFNSLYVAPELYDGIRTIKSEIYSLGCVLYYMATDGNINQMYEFTNQTTKAQKIFAHIYSEPNLEGIAKEIKPILQKMIEKRPSERIELESLINLEIINNEKSLQETLHIYQKMADDYIEYGLFKMGLFYEKGFHVAKDLEKAKLYYEKAIFKGSAKAYFHFGRLILIDEPIKAREYLRRAYELGITEASLFLEGSEEKIVYLYQKYEKFKEKNDYSNAISYMKEIINVKAQSNYYNLLGILYKKTAQNKLAIEAFEKGLTLDPNKKTLLMNLADMYNNTYDFINARRILKKIKKHYPSSSTAYRKYGVLYKNEKQFDKAIEAYKLAIELKPNSAEIKNDLGQLMILRKEFTEGFAMREARLNFEKNKTISSLCIKPRYNGEDLEDKVLLVYREQGLGDTIHYLRYLPLLRQKCKKIIFRVDPSLKELMEQTDYVDELIVFNDEIENLEYDYHVSLLSLPHFFLQWKEAIPVTIPYLFLPSDFSKIIEVDVTKFNIGIVWEGGTKSANNKRRNVDLKYFEKLFKIKGIQLYSLQLSRQNKTIYDLGYEKNIMDISSKLNSMMDTAKIIESLDLVISVDTSVLHLAGALGKETWLPMQYLPEYRWGLEDEFSYWYPTIKMFRENKRKEDGNWDDVFLKMKQDLAIKVSES